MEPFALSDAFRPGLDRPVPGRAIVVGVMQKDPDSGVVKTPKALAPLAVGDQLPWRLTRDGESQWLVVTEVIDASSYRVRYPNGTTGLLVDSE